eukprot:jgi/Chrpa1/17226/Chrysochromulina_OHIO_Genome00024024-RA
MGFAATKRKERGRKKKRGTFGANSSGKLHMFKNSLSSSSDSLKRVLESVGARAALSLPNSVKNNCGFEVLAITILVLPAKLRAGRRLQDVASALAADDGHKALDESERRMLHELALQVEDDLAALRELVAVATGAVMSAQLDAASSLETYAIDSATPAGRALAMLGDASSANGAWFTRLLRLLRLAAAAAVYKRPSGSRCASARGRKPLLPPDVVDAKTEGRRVSGEVLDALLGELGFCALLLTSDATSDETHLVLLGPAAAAAPFIGTLLLGMEDAHYRLVLTRQVVSTAPDAAPSTAADAAAIAAAVVDNSRTANGAAIGAARRLKSAEDMERWLHNCAAREDQRDDASEVLARMHAFGPSRSLLRWVRGGGDVGGHRMVASPKRSTQESAMDPNEGDYVRFKHKRVETTGTVLKRSGKHIRVQPKDGGATLWKELSELLPQQNEASEVAELQRLFSSGPSSARAIALSTRDVQAAAKQTVSERPNKIGMPTPMPKPAAGPLQATPPEINRELFEAAPQPPHRHALGTARPNAFDDTNLDGIDDAVAVAAQLARAAEAEAEAKSAGERLAGILRIRGGMGAGASALTDESPDADIKAAYESASAQERSVFLVDVGEQHKRKLVSLGLDVPEAAPSGLTPGTPLPSDVDRSIAALEHSLALNRARQRDLRDEEAVIFSQLQELRSSAKQAAKDAAKDACTPLPPKLRQALTELDKIVIQVLLGGAIRLLCVKWLLMQPANFKMPNRQALEEIERSLKGASPSPLLSCEEAAALVERGDRSIGALTYGWLSPGDPDPDGSRFRVLRRALMGMAIRIEALFWDFGSLYQAPRTREQAASFKLALEGGAMNQLYASILATTVLQIEEIPPRPAEFDGVVCLFKLSANVDENMVCAALVGFGIVKSCDLSHSPPIVRFASHLSAVAAKDAGSWPGLCEGLDTLYNETPYFSRGWCCCEDSLSRELMKRLTAYPALRVHLDKLQPKVFALSSDAEDVRPIEVKESELEAAADVAVERIKKSKFTSKGDKDKVISLYEDYARNTVGALTRTLGSLELESTEGTQVALPPMPAAAAGVAAMRAWHLDCLREQHEFIPDALSGFRLNTLTQCVPIGVEGHDADGKPLAVRDARSLCVLLQGLHASVSPCALLTAGPAAGKTWLMSQLIMHSIDGDLLPILVEVQRLQKALAEHEAAFAAAPDWVDAFLRLTCAPDHYGLLRAAMDARRALVLLDGLDEAGRERARIEAHVATVL